jgi:hypothetical protein
MAFMDLFKKREAQPKMAESLDLPPPPVPEAPIPSSEVRIVNEPAPTFMDEPEQMVQETISPVTAAEMAPPMPEEHIESPRHVREQPLFVSVEDYQQVLGSISYIRNRLQDAEALVKKLNELKGSEEKEFDAWRSQLEDLQKKLAYVEDVIFAANEV